MTDHSAGSWTPHVLFVTTTPAIHKSGVFRLLGTKLNVLFVFFSRGSEPYKSASAIPVYDGLQYRNAGAAALGHLHSLAALLRIVATSDYQALVKCINGKAELIICYGVCRLRRRRFVLWTGIWKWPGNRRHFLGRPVVRYICRRADAVCTYGSHVSRFLEEQGVRSDRLFTVIQPVQPDGLFRASGRLAYVPTGKLRVLFVGRLVEEKGLGTLLSALRPLSATTTLTVAGTGPERASLVEDAADAGLDVHWVGEQEPSQLAELYRRSDCVVIPSVTTTMTREPWGFVANEAMLSGCVVVGSTAVGAVAGGLIQDEVTGLVFEEGNHEALSRQLDRLTADGHLWDTLSRAGEQMARKFTEELACTGFVDAIESVLDTASQRPRHTEVIRKGGRA